MDFDEIKKGLLQEIRQERRTYLTYSALLTAYSQTGPFPCAPIGCDLGLHKSEDGGFDFFYTPHLSDYSTKVTVPQVLPGEDMVHAATGELKLYFNPSFGSVAGGFLADQTGGLILDELLSLLFDGKKLLGEVAGFATDVGMVVVEYDSKQADGEQLTALIDDADYCGRFRLDATISNSSTQGFAKSTLVFYPSAQTDEIIRKFNEYLADLEEPINGYDGTTKPVTLSAVIKDSKAIKEIMDQMSQEESEDVFD